MSAFLELSQLGKSFETPSGPALIVDKFSLKIPKGEFVCIIGHSGCGKSTVLSILMGLSEATKGGVIMAGREVTEPGLDRGVVFQSPSLLPWLTARENVLLAVEQVENQSCRKERRRLADKYLALVGLEGMAGRYPEELSAGMRQRVGIARAFALQPKVLLLDEPFSLLDALTRMELQDELMRLWEEDRKTVVMVTHDVDEALLLADRIVLMTDGPAATVGEIVTVPFSRPRRRLEILADHEYDHARNRLITFLEERADRGSVADFPAETAPTPYIVAGRNGRASRVLSDEERFVIEKYAGLNRFRAKYRDEQPLRGPTEDRGKASVDGTWTG
jgi:nitrate ABC transporter ATP-binding subunit